MPTLEIALSERLHASLEQTAQQRNQPLEQVVQEALGAFLRLQQAQTAAGPGSPPMADRAWRRARIHAEAEAWRAMSPAMRSRYGDHFVAVHGGQVVDHDANRMALYRRVRDRLGDVPILITPAAALSPRQFTLHSPRLERLP